MLDKVRVPYVSSIRVGVYKEISTRESTMTHEIIKPYGKLVERLFSAEFSTMYS